MQMKAAKPSGWAQETSVDKFRRRVAELKRRLLFMRMSATKAEYQIAEVRHLQRVFAEFEVDFVFDVGANAGQYGQMLRREVGYSGRIASFEPIPALAEKVEKLASRDSLWEVHRIALSDCAGEADFHVMQSDQFSSLRSPSTEYTSDYDDVNIIAHTIKVRTEVLKTVFEEIRSGKWFSNPYLKMDTQGHDLAVFDGAGAVFSQFIGLQSELAFKPLYSGGDRYDVSIERYRRSGFELSAMVPNNRSQFPWLVEMDAIFLNTALIR